MSPVPIFFVCGAFGTGKSTVAPLVAGRLTGCFVMDADSLIPALVELSQVDLYEESRAWPALRKVWLAIAAINAVAGRPSVFLSPAEPRELETLLRENSLDSYWLLLDCSDRELRDRLAQRDWAEAQIDEALVDARRMRRLGLESIRTDRMTPEESADAIAAWVGKRLP